MTDRLEGECDTQTPGQTTHGRPNDESLAKSWKDSGSIGNDSSRLAGSGPKGKREDQLESGHGINWLKATYSKCQGSDY